MKRYNAQRIWYQTGFDPNEFNEWGGLEKLAKVLPECFIKIKKNHSDKSMQRIKLTDKYSEFCSLVISDIYQIPHIKTDEFMQNPQVKPMYDAYNLYEESLNECHGGRGFNHCCFGEFMLCTMAAGITSGITVPLASKIASHYTQNPKVISSIGASAGALGFLIGLISLPIASGIIEYIKEERPSVRKKKEEMKKLAEESFIKDIDSYIEEYNKRASNV